ncbi:hypothetical protein A3J20_03935 [Candidatus Gottesmanbacteria bacterium RIFCSPLOWO2_02_FULL_42_29]|uniref:ABC transporter n=1 Tax=Candidatus Gottesmanbacteria bacterium RIFCSPLOWO2_01_FULL_42_22 TaxID=1798391 RepID=A0A1F6B957_9BACT|nr:MAG: hypothetical protein A2781_01805 [Candidatus Gottesmanbacteria bacterium RIFCSPHIGHO2_01_FULL_42_27]OGG20329.1 MAG: hypothetical protein A3E72_04355 [Candidatus Gottesmanbacteria bacterium RIFCSPHIGHO2_12_FULL_43_26]OGG33300.1 MAG: hypothetical protein A3G68_06825 [Candidatus Gottesmanbacteria bacterium RIFCSPLOWO2_12_FULL_42_10]OGG33466.1 MAG: hypothetical protein A2968_02770 [Candidatus Gottesmanbacteria bacterium RIFCSPLOWO2_01_FULL_42_22]OGG39485.1 MAG: hypothetical protein A3J20_03
MNKYQSLITIIKNSVADLIRNKLRSFLTMLGIIIGISSVILLISLGLGLKMYIQEQFKALGSNLIIVMPGKMMSGGGASYQTAMMSGFKFEEKDVQALKKLDSLNTVVPLFSRVLDIASDKENKVYETIVSNEEIFDIMNMEIEFGRLYNKGDVSKRKKIAVLGFGPAEKLFGSAETALEKNVKIGNQTYKVVGVLEKKGGGGGVVPSIDDHVFIPHTAAISFNPGRKFMALYARAADEQNIEQTKNDIKEVMLKKYSDDDFSISDQKELLSSINSIFDIISLVLTGIAAISLIVGGVGILNIMYVSVAERTKEIGIRRAYGATRNDILVLFLTESALLSVLGGFIGLIIAQTAVLGIKQFFPAYIDLTSIILALAVSWSIGLIFGVLPAVQASKLTPIEAIRRD